MFEAVDGQGGQHDGQAAFDRYAGTAGIVTAAACARPWSLERPDDVACEMIEALIGHGREIANLLSYARLYVAEQDTCDPLDMAERFLQSHSAGE